MGDEVRYKLTSKGVGATHPSYRLTAKGQKAISQNKGCTPAFLFILASVATVAVALSHLL